MFDHYKNNPNESPLLFRNLFGQNDFFSNHEHIKNNFMKGFGGFFKFRILIGYRADWLSNQNGKTVLNDLCKSDEIIFPNWFFLSFVMSLSPPNVSIHFLNIPKMSKLVNKMSEFAANWYFLGNSEKPYKVSEFSLHRLYKVVRLYQFLILLNLEFQISVQ